MQAERSWRLKIAFVDNSPSFAHGWEAGKVYAALTRGESPVEATVHAANREMLQRVAVAEGHDVVFADLGAGWFSATFTRCVEAPRTGNPFGLRLVKEVPRGE